MAVQEAPHHLDQERRTKRRHMGLVVRALGAAGAGDPQVGALRARNPPPQNLSPFHSCQLGPYVICL